MYDTCISTGQESTECSACIPGPLPLQVPKATWQPSLGEQYKDVESVEKAGSGPQYPLLEQQSVGMQLQGTENPPLMLPSAAIPQ